MTEEFLNGSYVVTVLEQVCGERVAKCMRGDTLLNFGGLGGFFDGFLQAGFMNMVALGDASTGVAREVRRREYILPKPFTVGVGVFLFEGVREVNRAEAIGEVLAMSGLYPKEVLAQGGD